MENLEASLEVFRSCGCVCVVGKSCSKGKRLRWKMARELLILDLRLVPPIFFFFSPWIRYGDDFTSRILEKTATNAKINTLETMKSSLTKSVAQPLSFYSLAVRSIRNFLIGFATHTARARKFQSNHSNYDVVRERESCFDYLSLRFWLK